jgi:PAS domain S-box-containing protein
LLINPSFEKQTGLRDAAGKRMREFAPDHEEHWFETYGRIALTGESIRFENRAELLHRWYDVYAFRFGEPKNLQVAILFNDITQRKKAEEQLREFKHFFNNSNDLCLIANMDGYFETINPNLEKVLGYSEKELTIRPFIDFVHPDDIPATLQDFEKQQSDAAVVMNFTHRFRKKDGSYVWIDWNSISNPDTGKIYAIGRDITERKQAEEQLKEYKYFFNNSNDFSCIANNEGYFEILNPKFEEELGYSQNELSKNPFLEFVHPDDIPATLLEYEKLKAGATTINFVNRFRKKDGSYLLFDWNATPNMLTGKMYCIARDITERKILDDKLKQFNLELEKLVEEKAKEVIEKEHQYRFLLENMREGIQVIGYDWKYLFVNNSLVEQGKYSNEELLGHTMMEKYPGIENTEMFKVLHHCMKERVPQLLENEFTFPDGSNEWFELSIQPVPEGLFILSMDITERKKADNGLLNSLKEITDYKYAINESSIVAFTDQKGIITHVNDNFCKISNYSSDELIGQDHRIINSGYHPKEFIRNLWETIAKGKIWRGELKNKAKDGTAYWVDTTIVPFLNKDGKPFQYIAITSDITKQKKAEEEMLRLSSILEATSDFVGIAATDQRIIFLNKAGRIALGFGEREDLSQTKISDYSPDWANEIIAKEGIPAALKTGKWIGETAFLTRGGVEIPISQGIIGHNNSNG